MQVQKISLSTAVFMIVANTVGSGIFTSLGFQLGSFSSPVTILALWVLGGLTALCGAFIYSELDSRFPGSGGETHFAEILFGPAWGFLAGWVSLIAGFAIPIAATAYACSRYLLPSDTGDSTYLLFSAFLIVLVGVLNSVSSRLIGKVQNIFVFLKIIMILGISFFLFSKSGSSPKLNWAINKDTTHSLFTAAFAVSLVFVNFAYSGWNAVVYIAKDVHNKAVNLPRAMFYGTLITLVLYVLFNLSLMVSTPLNVMAGKLEVASAAAAFHLPHAGHTLIQSLIALSLFTCLTSMVWAGSHVVMKCADSYPLFHFAVFKRNDCGVRATLVLSLISLLVLATMDFEKMIMSTGFLLVFFSLLCTLGLMWHRSFKKLPEKKLDYLASFYPWSAIYFVLINTWVAAYLLKSEKSAVSISALVIGLGFVVYKLQTKLATLSSGSSYTKEVLQE